MVKITVHQNLCRQPFLRSSALISVVLELKYKLQQSIERVFLSTLLHIFKIIVHFHVNDSNGFILLFCITANENFSVKRNYAWTS